MTVMVMRRALIFGYLAIVAGVCPARADAIDGQWCLGSGHFEISGPNIRTPGGNQITATTTGTVSPTSCLPTKRAPVRRS
jgi:hypothetical protein